MGFPQCVTNDMYPFDHVCQGGGHHKEVDRSVEARVRFRCTRTPTRRSHPVSASCSGAHLESPPMIHLPAKDLSVQATTPRMSMFLLCFTPMALIK